MRAFTRDHPVPSSSTSSRPVRSNVRREQLRRSLARAKSKAHNVGACGDTLRHLAVTVDGYTLDNPYGHFALYTDVKGWRELAHSLQTRAREHFDRLGEIEKARATDDMADKFPKWNALVDSWNALAEKASKIDEVGGIVTGTAVQEAISYCTTLVSEQLCFIEQADAAIVSYGETPPELPGPVKPAPPPASTTDIAKAALTLGAVGIVAFVVVQLVKS